MLLLGPIPWLFLLPYQIFCPPLCPPLVPFRSLLSSPLLLPLPQPYTHPDQTHPPFPRGHIRLPSLLQVPHSSSPLLLPPPSRPPCPYRTPQMGSKPPLPPPPIQVASS